MYKFITGFAVAVLIAAVVQLLAPVQSKFGNVVTQGIVPHIATSSTVIVGTSSITTLFAANSGCTDRIITTVAQPIMLSFSSSVTPSGVAGHLQAASTTVAYDNANYGCGAITAYGFSASTTITISAFSQ